MARRLCAAAVSFTLHLLVVAAIARLTADPPRAGRPAPRPSSMAVFVVPPAADPALPGLQALDTTGDDRIRRGEGSSTVSIPGFTFDIRKIGERATLLFPFLTPGLSLEHFAIAPRREVSDGYRNPFAPASPATPHAGPRRPALVMTSAAMQSLVDQSWSRRDRWSPFQRIMALADRYSADTGKLPALLHEYQAQNGLQPYVDSSMRDPRLWTELGLAADHVRFIGFISRYVTEHRSTRAATELLFLLDKLVQAGTDALITLLDTEPSAELRWTRDANPQAYDLIVDLRRYYHAQLERKGLASSDALGEYFDNVRLSILTGILKTTPRGYRASDARFLIGAIHWRRRDVGDALRAWREMTVDPSDTYAASIERILGAIGAYTGGDRGNVDTGQVMHLLSAEINRTLRNEHGRWIMFSMDRLAQFGFHFDTF